MHKTKTQDHIAQQENDIKVVAPAVIEMAKHAATLKLNARQRALAYSIAAGTELAFSHSGQMGDVLSALSYAYDDMMGLLFSLQAITGDEFLLAEMVDLTSKITGKPQSDITSFIKDTKAVLSGVKQKLNPEDETPETFKVTGPAN